MIQEIKTDKFEGILVKYPYNASDLVLPKIGMVDLYFHLNNDEYESVPIPQGQWKLIGDQFELSEEECEKITPFEYDGTNNENINGFIYQCYDESNFTCDTAIESFSSLLKSLQVYKENPYGEMPVNSEFYWGYLEDLKQWQEAEERTGSWILIQKIG